MPQPSYARLWVAALCALLPLFVGVGALHAQEAISLSRAWQQAQADNYSLRIANLELERAGLQAFPGAAGLAPTVEAFGVTNNSINNTRLIFANGGELDVDAAAAFSFGAGVLLDWNIWHGNANRLQLWQLKTHQHSMYLQRDQRANDLAADVAAAWYRCARAQALLAVQDSNINRSELRLELATVRYEGGQYSKTEVLQAEVDLKADHRARLQVALEHRHAQVELARVMGMRATDPLRVANLGQPDTSLRLGNVLELAESTQPSLLLARNHIALAKLAQREARARRMPRVDMGLGTDWANSRNPASFVIQSRNVTFAYGLGARLNLFDGRQLRQTEAIRRIETRLAEVSAESEELEVFNYVMEAWQGYQTGMEQMVLEQNLVLNAQENLELAQERYRLGRGTQLDLRQAQLGLVQAEAAELEARYVVLQYATELHRLSGTLADTLVE